MPLVEPFKSPKVPSITGSGRNFSEVLSIKMPFFLLLFFCPWANITFLQAYPCWPGLQGNNKEKGVGSQHLPVLMLNTCQEIQREEVERGGSRGGAV